MSVLDRVEAIEKQINEISRNAGLTDEKVKEIPDIRLLIVAVQNDVSDIKTNMAILKTKIAVWSSLGGLIGAGVVSAVVAIATKGFG